MTLKRLLEGTIPDRLCNEIPTRYDVIGNIAIVSVPASCDPYWQDIALAIMAHRRNVKTVLSRLPGQGCSDQLKRWVRMNHDHALDLSKMTGQSRLLHRTPWPTQRTIRKGPLNCSTTEKSPSGEEFPPGRSIPLNLYSTEDHNHHLQSEAVTKRMIQAYAATEPLSSSGRLSRAIRPVGKIDAA